MSDEPNARDVEALTRHKERERLCTCPPFHPAGMPGDTHTYECSRHWVLIAERIAQARREGAAEALTEAADDAVPRFNVIPTNRNNTIAVWLRDRAAALRGDA